MTSRVKHPIKAVGQAFFLFDLILYVPVKNYSVMLGGVFGIQPVLSRNKYVLLRTQRSAASEAQPLVKHSTTESFRSLLGYASQ